MSNPPTKRSASLSGPEHAPKQDVIAQQQPTPLNLTTVEIPSTLIASLVNSNTRRSPSRSRAGSEFHISPRTPTKELEEEFRLKIRRLKHSVQLKPPSESALRDAKTIVNDLAAALEVKMETAVIGVLTTINNAVSIPGVAGGEALRALFKQGCAQVIVETLLEFNASTSVCEKVLKTMALMCRPHDDNKASASLENAKAFGIADGAAAIAKTLLKHVNESTVLETACDAVRSMCVLPSNRTRFGDAGVCDIIARALGMKRFAEMAETCCWICRALGHLAKENEQNCERLGSVGVCETAVSALQIHTMNSSVCREVCWVLRTVAPLEGNRGRILDQFGPEKIISVFKSFHKDLEFSLEACKVVLSLIASEEDEVIVRITNAGIVSLILKALRRYTSSDQLSTAAFNVFYFISCDDKLRSKLCNSELFDLLSLTLEEHAGDAGMAEWGCRTVHNLVQVNGMAHRMKNAGLCEMVVSCVQRQAISATVCGYGCLAIGDLAMDKANHTRLTDSGACEAVVGSLRRHDGSPDVVFQTCYAIHYLAATENNVGWIGANGGCEAITTALAKHIITSVDATRGCLRAIGSLAISNEGNMAKFHSAGACEVVVAALRSHGLDVITAESAFRAIYNLSPETNNVSEFGAKGACGLIAAGLLKHQGSPAVLTQACLATYALAVKIKVDKVHNGNTRKLVAKVIIYIYGNLFTFINN